MSRFDWPALMRAGMAVLRLTPREFWALTPAELRLMLGQGAGSAPLGRDGLEALMAAWPDGGGDRGGAGDDGSGDGSGDGGGGTEGERDAGTERV